MVELTEALKREIGQHFVFGFHGHEVSDDITVLIRDYHLGNVILMKRNVQSAEQTHGMIQKLQKIAKDAGHEQPLMIGIDQENGEIIIGLTASLDILYSTTGLVSAFSNATTQAAGTQFPGAMALAATGSAELTERVSAASGRELKLAGINWAYSPVADVNSDSRNPVIGVRSFGDDPRKVGEYVAAVCRGLTTAGVAPSAKHFPGHGDTHVDSHVALPVIPKTRVELEKTELVPFRTVVDHTASIMTGHMALPQVTGDDTPASLAREVTHGVLRESLGYKGVIVTDCLEMEAVAAREGGVPRAAVDALRAGADVVMVCHQFARHKGSLEAAYEAIKNGEINSTELQESGRRIEAMKERFVGGWVEVLGSSFDKAAWARLKEENMTLSRQAYAQSVALVHDPRSVVPLPKEGKVIVLTPVMESLNLAVDDAEGVLRTGDGKLRNTAGPSYLSFAQYVRELVGGDVIHLVYQTSDWLTVSQETDVHQANAVVFVTRNADRSVWQRQFLAQVLRARTKQGMPENVVVLASCAPYDLIDVGDEGALLRGVGYVASFEFTVPALTAAARVIFGEEQAKGHVPVCRGLVVGASA
ncbi:hypothetical protein EW146_g4327 [Bondarzewia mesenterica]|uniref:Glycoside hydrolase family 3 N-terminal domain-containing protein n=1 Tax=Bondarzewia mesenterica TaxID=1095465 RepID=A0A4S4LUX0_9AGAM|nr:hypothetical protein EW146_g4327 [Bondarzewia mesenterica]